MTKVTHILNQLAIFLGLRSEPEDEAQWAYDDDMPVDSAEALKWWRKGAEQGNADAQYNLGMIYLHGWLSVLSPRTEYPPGFTSHNAEAVKWFRKAADQGFADAQTAFDRMQEGYISMS